MKFQKIPSPVIRRVVARCVSFIVTATLLSPATGAEIHLVSTRHLSCPEEVGVSDELCVKSVRNDKVRPSSRRRLLRKLKTDAPICIYVHGNRMTEDEAIGQGLSIRERIDLGDELKFIAWSWPSEIIPGLIRDARIKATRSDEEAYYLAHFLADLPPHANVCLVGYSFGARITSGAVHMLAGGRFAGHQLTRPTGGCRPRVVMLAAAYPSGWLMPNGAHELTAIQAQRITSFYNPLDPALGHYNFVFQTRGVVAMGYKGISRSRMGPATCDIRQYNVQSSAGKTHALNEFIDSRAVMHTVRLEAYGR